MRANRAQRIATLAVAIFSAAGSNPALAQAQGWVVDTCYSKQQLDEQGSKPGIEYRAGLAPEISPGVSLETRDDDTESPFYDKTLRWKMARFAQMMSPGGFDALVQAHMDEAGETTAEARKAMITERQVIWLDLRTNGIRIKVSALFRDKASGRTAKLLSDDVPDTGEPTKFCIVETQ